MGAAGERLGAAEEPREAAGAQPGHDAEEGGAEEVAHGQVDRPLDREQRSRPVDAGEDQVASGARHHRREEHVPSEVILVRHLEGEDRPGRRRLEDGGDAGRRAGDQQHPPVGVTEPPREPPLQVRAHHRAGVQRGPLEAHRPARAEGGQAGQRARHERPQPQGVAGVMERLQVVVGRRRGDAAADEPAGGERDQQAETWQHRDDPGGQAQDAPEGVGDHEPLEAGDEQTGHRARDRRPHDDLARPAGEGTPGRRDGTRAASGRPS